MIPALTDLDTNEESAARFGIFTLSVGAGEATQSAAYPGFEYNETTKSRSTTFSLVLCGEKSSEMKRREKLRRRK